LRTFLLLLGILLCGNARPQSAPGTVGWYNGNWQSGVRGLGNWMLSGSNYSRVYDDFVVPEGGWTVVSVFSQNRMNFSPVTKASWEIRRDMAPGKGGKKVAAGKGRASQIPIAGQGPYPNDSMAGYRIQVDGLKVRLAPGRYWLSVTPIVPAGTRSFANATKGRNAQGDPPGNNGGALVRTPKFGYEDAWSVSTPGQQGIARDFSQGVIIAPPTR
jgi:hypothetical protein